jgi:hypothetical protein
MAQGTEHPTSWRRPVLWGVAGTLGVVVLATVWLAWTASQAKAQLTQARSALPAVRAAVLTGDGKAGGQLDDLRKHAVAADNLTHDPVWYLAGAVPWLGDPVATTAGLTRTVRTLAEQSLPDLARVADTLHPAQLLRGGGTLDVAGLAKAAPAVDRVATSLHRQRDAITELAPSWYGPVASARSELLDQLTSLTDVSRDGASAAKLLPPMLGLNGTRRYFVAFQNPAEQRGTGGLLDAFAIVVADHGSIRVERTGSNMQLPSFTGDVAAAVPQLDEQYVAAGATTDWLEANASPNFPDTASVWEAMWHQATGQQLDGALAIDPRALSAVLAATGAVDAPVVGQVGAGRIEQLVLHDQYSMPGLQSSVASRKSLMLGVGTAVMDAVLHGKASPGTLLPGLQTAAEQGHIQLHSRFPAELSQLEAAGIAGAVDTTSRPFAQVVVENAAGGKLDSWLDSSLGYKVTKCTADHREVMVTVTLRNDAPKTGLPSYVTVRSDQPLNATAPSQNRTDLQILATRGATLLGARLDGAPLVFTSADGKMPATIPDDAADAVLVPESVSGHPAYVLELELVPGKSRTVTLQLSEPPTTASPLLPLQPMVKTPVATADVAACTGSGR